MFEQVCIASPDDRIFDVADALVYYGVVDVDATAGTIATLCKTFGADVVCSLVDADNLRILYNKHNYVVQSENGPISTHKFASFFLAKNADKSKVRHPHDAIEQALRIAFPGDFRLRKMARDLTDRVIIRPHYPDIARLAADDLRDDNFRDSAIASVLNELVPGAVDDSFRTELTDLGDRFVVPMVLDFKSLNEQFHRTVSPEYASISPAYILAHLITARQHLALGAERNGDMWLPSASATLINLRLNSIATRIEGQVSNLSHFENVVFEGRSFGAALKSGQRTASEFLAFVQSEETKQLKSWVSGLPAGSDLLVEYTNKNASRGVLGSAPARAAKVSVFTGLGVAADAMLGSPGLVTTAAVGLALGGVDEFLASKLRLGWRPNSWAQSASGFLGDGAGK